MMVPGPRDADATTTRKGIISKPRTQSSKLGTWEIRKPLISRNRETQESQEIKIWEIWNLDPRPQSPNPEAQGEMPKEAIL